MLFHNYYDYFTHSLIADVTEDFNLRMQTNVTRWEWDT